ncbi:protein DEK [Spea bombifrons]|uniref:protein DEK n=1 Tax=Spea bombifrons TaxID=233779 RepID=UPI00234A14E7|nr:protein DEK [Spea bombifrons]XP_053323023.1 protein DEK [Spea bombifrons]
MSSDAVSDAVTKESETVEQQAEEKVAEDTANGNNEQEEANDDEDDEEEEEEEEEDDEDEKKEKSLIVEGKREKKKVERLSLEMTVIKKEPVLTEGKGQKLYDIERVQYFLRKKKCEELRPLHRLLFNRLGTVNLVKKNIGQFNGFPFEKGSEQYKKKEDMLKKFKKSELKNICGVLDLEKSGVNSELISKIMNFLMEPKSTGKSLPKSKAKPQKSGKKERSSSGSARKSRNSKSNVILTDESSSEDEKKDKEDSSEEEKESDEEEEPPKKTPKKEKAKPKSTPKSKKAAKSSNVKKADSSTTNKKSPSSTKKEKVVQSESESDDSSDDEPLIKKLKKPPTDDELRETVKKLLADANLEEVTMKQICKKVNESYPNVDLFPRKKFIKATVKELIS